MRIHAKLALHASSMAVLSMLATPAFAAPDQDQAAGATAASGNTATPQNTGEGFGLEEIVVTAQRREESASRVPISIAVMGGEALANKSVSNLETMTQMIPNFQIAKTGLTSQTFIRGIGSGNDPAFEQSVAQYMDGVSYGRASLTRAPFFDVQRVEVLRGPQSILFGKNSTAGAVSIISAQPTDTMRAGMTTTYTPAFHEFESNAFASGPITDGLSARVALRYLKSGGNVYNITKDRDEPKNEDIGVRGTLRYESGGFKSTLKVEYSKFDMDGRDLEVVHDVATRTVPAGPLAGKPLTYARALTLAGLPNVLTDTTFNYRRESDIGEFDNTRLLNATWTNEFDVGASTFTSITAYVDYKRKLQVDLDFTSADILSGNTREDYNQFSQELRLTTPASNPLSFIGGLYFERNQIDYADTTGLGRDLANLGFGVVAGVSAVRNYQQVSNSYAGFGQVTFRPIERIRLIAGARLTHDDKNAQRRIVARTGRNDYDAPLVTNPATIGALQNALGFNLDNPGGVGHNISDRRGVTRFVPSATIEGDITETVMAFGSYKEGYKGGGFNARANNVRNFEFDDETVKAFEFGVRSKVFANKGQISLTAYRSTYSNLQIAQFDGAVGFNVGNAGKTRVQGIEADARLAVARGVTIGGAASYLDFKYLDFRRGNCAFGETPNGDVVSGVRLCDYTGRRGRFSPKWNFSGNIAVDRPLTDNLNVRANIDVSYKSSHNIHDNLDRLGQIDGYTIVDARLGIGSDNWDLAVIGKNLLNEQFLTYSANVPFASSVGANTQYASSARGRSVSIQATLRY
jgi:outer membrane receptor protein involved in Fe transport